MCNSFETPIIPPLFAFCCNTIKPLARPPTLYTNLVFSYNEVRRTRYREWYTCTFSKLKKIPDSVLEQGEQQKSEKPANYWFFCCRILCCLSYIIMIHIWIWIQFECFYQPNMCNARQCQLIIQSIKIVCMIHNSNIKKQIVYRVPC